MAPITWKNIAAPDFSNTIAAFESARRSFSGIGDNLQDILAKRNKINEANWDNQSRINTDNVLAARQQARNLADFHQQSDQFNLGALRNQYGAQVDVGRVDEGSNALLAKLRQQAIGNATLEGNRVAEQTMSPAAASQAFTQHLQQNMMRPDIATTAGIDYMNKDLAIMQKAWAEKNAADSEAFLNENVRGKKLTGMDLDPLLKAASAAGIKDLSLVKDGINQSLGFETTALNAQDAARTRRLSQEDETVTKSADAAVAQALDLNDRAAGERLIKSIPDAKARLTAWSNFKQYADTVEELKPEDQDNLAVINNAVSVAYDEALAPALNLVEARKKDLASNLVMDDAAYKEIESSAGQDGVLKSVLSKSGKNGILGIRNFGSKFVSDTDFQDILVPAADSLRNAGFSDAETNKIILGTFQQMAGTGEAWTGNDAINAPAFLERIYMNTQRMVKYQQSEDEVKRLDSIIQSNKKRIDQDKLTKSVQAAKAIKNSKWGSANYDPAAILESLNLNIEGLTDINYGEGNTSRTPKDMDSVQQQLDIIRNKAAQSRQDTMRNPLNPVNVLFPVLNPIRKAAEELQKRINKE